MPNITSYEQADRYLGPNKSDRPLCNKTRIQRRGYDAIAIMYHNTDVVTYHPDGRIVFNRGGYLTKTTADRISEYSPYRVVAGALYTTWSRTREFVRKGSDVWTLRGPDGFEAPLLDGQAVR